MIRISPSLIKGTVSAPASKSHTIRATAAALLARGESYLIKPSFCDDALAGFGAAEALGAAVEDRGTFIKVRGGGPIKGRVLNCRESGLCLRMFAPIAALQGKRITLTGSGSLKTRPMGMLEEPLRLLGVEGKTNQGHSPVRVKGPLRSGRIKLDGSLSSQFLSGLLTALPLCSGDSELLVTGLKSKPYAAMTVEVLSRFGISLDYTNTFDMFSIKGNQRYTAASCDIEGDWSGAAFLLVAGALCGEVTVTNLNKDSCQADKKILEALDKAGANFSLGDGAVRVTQNELKAFTFDAAESPDLFPPLVALACGCGGKSVVSGVGRLKHKESDRAISLLSEFSKMGAKIHLHGDKMEIEGTRLQGGAVDSFNDHRIAMACAVAGLKSEEGVTITGERCVSKSYPDFFVDLKSLEET